MSTRIAYVHSIPHWGSTEHYLQALVGLLDRNEFEPWLVVPDHEALDPLAATPAFDGRVVRVSIVPGTTSVARTILAYARALRRIRPDLVHCGEIDPPAFVAARLAGARRLVFTHNAPRHRPRHNVVGKLVRRLGWATRPHAIYTSAPDLETGLTLDPIPRARATAINLGIDLERFSPAVTPKLAEVLPESRTRRVVGTVGRICEHKGYRYLVEAAVKVLRDEPETLFVVVGDGELRGELERLIADRGLNGSFRLLGHREDVPELVAGFDVFALSSTVEGMCLAVVEAMAIEKPVVATAVGGVPESVVGGETGVLVPPRDPDALASEILRLLRDEREARRLAAAGRERARARYSQQAMAAATEALYRRLLA